jgi:indole-3-glycerol phosphate synthase
MKGTILEKIINTKRERVESANRLRSIEELRDMAAERRTGVESHQFLRAVSSRSRVNVITEYKRASPSKGLLNDTADPSETAQVYERSGAAAISVLTEEDHFLGSLANLETVRSAVSIPVLRKDFIFDEYQIVESAASGADAVLLIVSMLTQNELTRLLACANEHLLDVIVEVHDERELHIAVSSGAPIIGVNNRDLKSFEVSLDVSRELIKHAPAGTVMISESGLRSAAEIRELHQLGYSAFLIGETLMKSGNLGEELRSLIGVTGPAREPVPGVTAT